MPFLDTSSPDVIERLPGWYGRYFHSTSMTFAHYGFTRGSSIQKHAQEKIKSENLMKWSRLMGMSSLLAPAWGIMPLWGNRKMP
jgi:hypothetical protein